ncbi:MAG: phosphoenolpyruvate--protein phosphotransferase [Planctomycetota bacterium]
MEHKQLLIDIGELSSLFQDSVSIETVLDKTVELVSRHAGADACSIYLYDDNTEELTLKATKGLNPDAVDKVKIKLGEGLTGLALEQMRTVCEKEASKNPAFKYFPGFFDDRYECYAAIPITRGINRIGVMVLQRQAGNYFTDESIEALKAVASQLGNIIENARFLMAMYPRKEVKPVRHISEAVKFIKAKAASRGFAYAPAMIIDKRKFFAFMFQKDFRGKYDLGDFQAAVSVTEKQLGELQKQVEQKLSDAASLIFASHLLILKDKAFTGEIEQQIKDGQNAPAALLEVVHKYTDVFFQSENMYVREKIQDLEDLAVRLLGNLVKDLEKLASSRGRVVIARELYPSDLLKMSSENVAAIILVSGGISSHLSILAGSLEIPMLIANKIELLDLPEDVMVLADAEAGNIYINPDEEVVRTVRGSYEDRKRIEGEMPAVSDITRTRDGTVITLLANINLLSDLEAARRMNCQGIGLYRTEFPFMIRTAFPSEAEQYVIYRRLVENAPKKLVTFRTLDIGGDKVLPYFNDITEQNPALGMRSIRFSLHQQEIFRQQIRAILRAGKETQLRIMFPMISSLDEFIQAKSFVPECIEQLEREEIEHNPDPLTGMMIEVPCVLDIIDDLAAEADFFSIGTNDFIQFMLAADRTNENVAAFYLPHHPSVLRALKKIADSAVRHNIEVTVCGDMAHQVVYLPFLLGIGIRTFSLAPTFMPVIQKTISQIDINEAQAVARDVLTRNRISEIAEILGLVSGSAAHSSRGG